MNWPATLMAGGRRGGCTIVDLSLTGARLHAGQPIAEGTRLTVASEKFGSVDATAIWSKGAFVGIRFDEPAHRLAAKLKPLLDAVEVRERALRGKTAPAQFGRKTYHGRPPQGG